MKKIVLCLLSIMLLTFNATNASAATERTLVRGEKNVAGAALIGGVFVPVAMQTSVSVNYTPEYYDILTVDSIHGYGQISKNFLYSYSIIPTSSQLLNNGSVVASKSSGFSKPSIIYPTNYQVGWGEWYPNKLVSRTKASAGVTIQGYDSGSGHVMYATPTVGF